MKLWRIPGFWPQRSQEIGEKTNLGITGLRPEDRKKMKKEWIRKFRGLSTSILGKEETEKLIANVLKLENIQKVNTLTNLSKG
jgi:hypothetical protein